MKTAKSQRLFMSEFGHGQTRTVKKYKINFFKQIIWLLKPGIFLSSYVLLLLSISCADYFSYRKQSRIQTNQILIIKCS